MKQLSNTNFFRPRFFRYQSTPGVGTFFTCVLIVLLTVVVITGSSFQKKTIRISSHSLLGNSVPFEGKFTFSFGANGVSGAGIASHIGRFILVEQNNDEGFPVITGTATLTAANGDQIFANHTGLVQVLGNGTADVNSEFTITGGTGRFVGATGSFESHGPANLALGTGSSDFEGTISY